MTDTTASPSAATITFDFSGKVAIVTGSAGGIGQAYAEALADAGASVVVADIDIDKAEAGGDIVIVDRKQARAARRRAFGFNFSELSIFDRATPKEEMDNLVAKIASAHRNSDGRWVIVLEDGAVWREIGDPEPNLQPVPGATARISRGSLGSFFIKIDGLSTHVHRDQ